MNGTANTIGGLVGWNDVGSSISNSYATGNVTGMSMYIGGLAGFTGPGTTITASYATGNVSGPAGNVNGPQYVGGLLGENNGGTVSLSYATGNVNGGSNVGGLVGYSNSLVTLSYATGNVTGSNPGGAQSTGGLVGDNQGGTVSLSYATGNVSGERDTGGLVGRNYGGGLVTQSYATGAVTGSVYNPGGLVGYNEYTGTITYSYALGAVSLVTTSFGTPHWAGGLVGWNNGKVIQSYATGKLTADDLVNQFAGGLVGNVGDGSVAQSFWDMTTTGLSVGFGTASGSGSFSATAIQSSNPAGANYAYGVSTYSTSGWSFGTSPIGSGNDCTGACWVITDVDGTFNNAGGATGATRPFLLSEYSTNVSNAHELQLMALAPSASYTLGSNIDLGPALAPNVFGYPSMWSSAGFVPIGNATGFPTPTGIPFSGGSTARTS